MAGNYGLVFLSQFSGSGNYLWTIVGKGHRIRSQCYFINGKVTLYQECSVALLPVQCRFTACTVTLYQ